MDEFSQPMPNYDAGDRTGTGKKTKRGSKGNRAAQAKRYQAKNRYKLKQYINRRRHKIREINRLQLEQITLDNLSESGHTVATI